MMLLPVTQCLLLELLMLSRYLKTIS